MDTNLAATSVLDNLNTKFQLKATSNCVCAGAVGTPSDVF